MPRISEKESNARRTEIIDACEALYQHTSYRDITMAQIAGELSFSRANTYNYFQCKDEIFLALLQREYERWTADLKALGGSVDSLDDRALADGLARSLKKHPQLLKLMTMNLYDMEENSRLEKLAEFKGVYARAVEAIRSLVVKLKGNWDSERMDRFVFSFLPFVYGIYPYVFTSKKQEAAMRAAGMHPKRLGIYELSYPFILKMLEDDTRG